MNLPLIDLLLEGYNPEDVEWMERGLCKETDPEAFFPEKGGSTREPKRICQGCEVKAECLEYALANHERFGIWGGTSERERRGMYPAQLEVDEEQPAARKADTRERDAQIADLDVPGAKAWSIAEQVGVTTRTVVRSRRRRLADAA